MTRVPSICGVILSAGQSTRMGRDKALLPWPPNATAKNETFLSVAIRAFASFCDMVIVVGGKNAAAITPIVDANGAVLVVNPEPDRGQFSSLQCGLQEVLNHKRDAAMITLVDRPPVQPSTLEKLHEAFIAALSKAKWAVVPEYSGRHGHPIFIGREMMEAFLQADPAANARDIQHRNQMYIEYFPVDDPMVTRNVDTPEDYSKLASEFTQRGG
jgi:molybdenum cofactor cytidylyltransferase